MPSSPPTVKGSSVSQPSYVKKGLLSPWRYLLISGSGAVWAKGTRKEKDRRKQTCPLGDKKQEEVGTNRSER